MATDGSTATARFQWGIHRLVDGRKGCGSSRRAGRRRILITLDLSDMMHYDNDDLSSTGALSPKL